MCLVLCCVLVQKAAVLPGNEILIPTSQLLNALADCTGRFESGFLRNLLQRGTLIAWLQNLFVLLGKYRGFKLAPWIGNIIKLLTVDAYTIYQHIRFATPFPGA